MVPGMHPQNNEHGINIAWFLHGQLSASAVKHHFLVCVKQHLCILLQHLTQKVCSVKLGLSMANCKGHKATCK